MEPLADRLVIDKRNRILRIRLDQREQIPHGLNRDEDPRVRPVIAVPAHLSDHADHIKTHPIQQDGGPHRRPPGKHILEQLPSHNGHAAAFTVVLIVEPAAWFHRHIANPVVVRGNSEDLSIGGSIIANRAYVFAVENRRQCADKFGLGPHRQVVSVCEIVCLPGLSAARDCRDAPGKHEHDVLSERGKLLFLAAAESFSQAHQQQKRAHPPGNSEHGEERAQLMRPQSGQRLPDNVEEHSHE